MTKIFPLRQLLHAAAILTLIASVLPAYALDGIEYRVGTQVTASTGKHTPFWLVCNREGLGSIEKGTGFVEAAVIRTMEPDSARRFSWGAGVDLAAGWRMTSAFKVRQLYAEVRYRKFALYVGSKVTHSFMVDKDLSSGDLLFSGNALPIPQARIETPEWLIVPFTKGWLGLKGYFSFGFFTDGRWQEHHVNPGGHYTRHVLFHSKGGFATIGNPAVFPLRLTLGLEMAAQFGGTSYNGNKIIRMPSSIRDIIRIIVPQGGGSDTPMGEQTNIYGNHVGQWSGRLDWDGPKGWKAALYGEHYFEDHSMLFMDYKWKDGLIGIEIGFPENPFISKALYEFMNTTDQAGSVYWDHTPDIPEQVSGRDNYYNHGIYTGWQTWGMGIGNPLLLSPIYNPDNGLYFRSNRVKAHHFGFSGQPLRQLGWRVLLSISRSWGTYNVPFPDIVNNYNGLVELTFRPDRLKGWTFSGSLAADAGGLIGRSAGVMISIKKCGIL